MDTRNEEQPKNPRAWSRHRAAGAAIRVGVTTAPAVVSAIGALALNVAVPHASTALGIIVRSLAIVVASLGILILVDKGVRRLLPLAALLQLTLVFPDLAPSRF